MNKRRMIHTDDATWAKVRDAAHEDHVSIAEWVRRAIAERLATREAL